jgi:hypothetical protein
LSPGQFKESGVSMYTEMSKLEKQSAEAIRTALVWDTEAEGVNVARKAEGHKFASLQMVSLLCCVIYRASIRAHSMPTDSLSPNIQSQVIRVQIRAQSSCQPPPHPLLHPANQEEEGLADAWRDRDNDLQWHS